jgi:hypothetical protein
MPWMESSVTEERLRFVARLLDGGDDGRVPGFRGIAQAADEEGLQAAIQG